MDYDDLKTLPRDLKAAAATLGPQEVRYLVDSYYQLQDFRKASANQTRALNESEEPHETVNFFALQFGVLEDQIKKALDAYSASDPMGKWSREHVGHRPGDRRRALGPHRHHQGAHGGPHLALRRTRSDRDAGARGRSDPGTPT